jgi:hypothetical protein
VSRTLICGVVLALLAAVVAVTGSALGITTLWPLLLGAAVGFAAVPVSLGRVSAFVLGAVVSWVAMALRAGFLPDLPASRAIVVAGAVLLLAVVAAVTANRAPLWAGLVGYAAFAGLYEPLYAATPTAFLTESPTALLTVLLAGAIGVAAAELGQLLSGGSRAHVTEGPLLAGPRDDAEVVA